MLFLKRTILLLALVMLFLPAFDKEFSLIPVTPLKGYFEPTDPPVFSDTSWFSGRYQLDYTKNLNDSVGLKPLLVRMYNQADYSLFNVVHASNITMGEKQCIFVESQLPVYLGRTFTGERSLDDQVAKLKFLQDHLWEKNKIRLIFAFAPSQPFFYPELLPERYRGLPRTISDYEYYLRRFKESGIEFIDFNRWMAALKDTSKYVLFPKTGLHWSYYGAVLCADSLGKYLEARMDRPFAKIVIDSVETGQEARNCDRDLDITLNLFTRIHQPAMAYPLFHFTFDTLNPKPKALFIGDSFFWYWYSICGTGELNDGIIAHYFENRDYWHYNKQVYPGFDTTKLTTGQIDYPGTILDQDVVIILQTNGHCETLGYGFVDWAYSYFYPGNYRVKEIMKEMSASDTWKAILERKARENKTSFEMQCRADAISLEGNELKEQRTKVIR